MKRGWVVFLVMCASIAQAEFRLWTSLSGQSVEAEAISVRGETVMLRKRSGSVVPVPLDKLVQEDQRFAARYMTPEVDLKVNVSKEAFSGGYNRMLGQRAIYQCHCTLEKKSDAPFPDHLEAHFFLVGRDAFSDLFQVMDREVKHFPEWKRGAAVYEFSGEEVPMLTRYEGPKMEPGEWRGRELTEYAGYIFVLTDGTGRILAEKEQPGGLRDRLEKQNGVLIQSVARANEEDEESAIATGAQAEKQRVEWEAMGLGLYIHFGIGTFAGIAPNPSVLVEASAFRPESVDVEQWVEVAKRFGARYIELTVKHEYGFCLWDSKGYAYDLGKSPARNLDIIGALLRACKAQQIQLGVHYSLSDLYNEGMHRQTGALAPQQMELIKQQVAELCERYPEIAFYHFDWGNRLSNRQRRALHEWIALRDPSIVVNSTTVKKEGNDFVFSSPGLPAGSFVAKEFATSLVKTKSWMWEPNATLFPAKAGMWKYNLANKYGANYCIGVAPDRSGRIPQDQIELLMACRELMLMRSLGNKGMPPMRASLNVPLGADKDVQALKNGLVLEYSFDSPPKRGIVRDESGLGNHGEVVGAQWVESAQRGGCYRFVQSEVHDRIMVPDSDSLDCTELAISVWIKTDDPGSGWTRIVDKDWENGYCLSMGGTMPNGGKKWHGKAILEFSPKRFVGSGSKVTLNDGEWHHLVASYRDGDGRIFVDGQQVRKRDAFPEAGQIKVNDRELVIGNCHPTQHPPEEEPNAFDGLIDDLRIYNRVLSAAEVQMLYQLK